MGGKVAADISDGAERRVVHSSVVALRSGGQSGADRGAMDAARRLGVAVLGWCPAGGWAEDYPDPPGVLSIYPEMVETPSDDVIQRTEWNIRDSTCCIALNTCVPGVSQGTDAGFAFYEKYRLPYFVFEIDDPDTYDVQVQATVEWLKGLGEEEIVLGVGGPRESEYPGIYDIAFSVISSVLAAMGAPSCDSADAACDAKPSTSGLQRDVSHSVSFRFATRDDVPVILDFIRQLAEYEHALDRAVATERLLEEQLFDQRKAEVVFAVVSGREVGFALFFESFSTWLGRAGVFLEDLFVVPDERGKGYGRALLEYLAGIAVERGCGRLEWNCLDWNHPSIGFYLSLGAKAQDEWTTYRLEGDALSELAGGRGQEGRS